MEIRSKPDGKKYPVGGGGSSGSSSSAVSVSDMNRMQGMESKRRSSIRIFTRKEKAKMRTLENPLLYHNFKAKLEKLNPGKDIEQLISRSLEPEEALLDIKRRYPDVDIGLQGTDDKGAEFRQFLDDFGIDNIRIQNLIALDPVPFTDQELAQISYALSGRPAQKGKDAHLGKSAPLS